MYISFAEWNAVYVSVVGSADVCEVYAFWASDGKSVFNFYKSGDYYAEYSCVCVYDDVCGTYCKFV